MSTYPLPVVLDANVARGASLERLEKLALRGLKLRVAETAFLEWCAASYRAVTSGRSRSEARSLMFGRARRLHPFLDAERPLTLGGGLLSQRIVAMADGKGAVSAAEEYAEYLVEMWRRVSGIGMVDEEWLKVGQIAHEFLEGIDENLIDLLQRDNVLDAKTEQHIRRIADPREAAALNEQFVRWKAASEEMRFRESCAFAVETWQLSDAAAERLNAHICCAALRIREAARGARFPKKNDGADVSLTIHLGEGCVLVTQEQQLIKIVDASGTFQRPWVRHLDDLDDLPEGVPWGESARGQAASFRRRN